MGKTMNINGHEFNVIGQIKSKLGYVAPLLDVPMMSDEKWRQLCNEGVLKSFRKQKGRDAKNLEEAYEWQRECIAKEEERCNKAPLHCAGCYHRGKCGRKGALA